MPDADAANLKRQADRDQRRGFWREQGSFAQQRHEATP